MCPGSMKGYIEAAVVMAEAAASDPASSLHISLGHIHLENHCHSGH